MQKRFVYVTTQNHESALLIGQTLVEEKLVACVNILNGATSIYWWEGKVETASESVLIAKTTDALEEQVIERIKALHIYDCPCIVTLPIENGNKEFLSWIEGAVKA